MEKRYKTFDEYCDAIQELTEHALNHLWDLEQLANRLPQCASSQYKMGTINIARTELNNIFDALREIEDDCTGLTEGIKELKK